MEFYVLRFENEKRLVVSDDLTDAIIEMLSPKPLFNRVLDMSQVTDKKVVIRLKPRKNMGKTPETRVVNVLTYPEYCKRFKNEVAERKPCCNRANAWRYFYPDGHGIAKKGYALHHKDESLRHENPTRYNMWLPEDLVMMTRSEHQRHHAKGRNALPETRALLRKHMLGNRNNSGKRWFNNGEVNVRTFEAPEGFVAGQIRKVKEVEKVEESTKIGTEKPIKQLDKNGKIIQRWKSAKEASIQLGINNGSICSCLKKKRKTAGGYKWRYIS